MNRLRVVVTSAAVFSALALATPGAMAGTSASNLVPTQPANLHVVSATDADIEIAFTPGTEHGGSYVNNEVFVDDEPDQFPSSYDEPDGDFHLTFNRAAGLIPGSAHTFRIRAIDQSGNFTDSETITASFAPGDNTPPTAPSNLHLVSQDANGATVAWNASSDQNPVEYFVDGVPCMTQQVGSNSTTVIPSVAADPVCGVLPGFSITITVRARDSWDNDSSSSNPLRLQF